MKKVLFVAIIIVIVAGVGFWWRFDGGDRSAPITNFEECAAVGNPVMESYPRQCRYDGAVFVEEIPDIFGREAAVFTDSELGISFLYPKEFGEVKTEIFMAGGKRPAGSTGEKLAGTFSEFSTLEFGGITDDFSAGREGLLTDTRGFSKQDDKYYFKFVSAKPDLEIQPLKVIGKDFGETLILDDKSFEAERNHSSGPVLGVGSGRLAGLVNLKNDKFPGIVFYNWDTNAFSLDEFEIMLGSVEVFAPGAVFALSQEEALNIARDNKECLGVGVLTDDVFYNENSKTWWIDLERMPELKEDGCNPACVVLEETKTAEVNWRCTGAKP